MRLVRNLSIVSRLLLTAGVPLVVLVLVLGTGAVSAHDRQEQARRELERLQMFRAVAGLQSEVVQPEMVAAGLLPGGAKGTTAAQRAVQSALWNSTAVAAASAVTEVDGLLGTFRSIVPATLERALRAEADALEPVLAGDVSSAGLARLVEARTGADDALTDFFLSSERGSWITYQGIIEIRRATRREAAAVLVTLGGGGVSAPQTIAALAGARRNAVDRSLMGAAAGVRDAVKASQSSAVHANYERAVTAATRIAANQQPPLSDAQLVPTARDLQALGGSVQRIAALAEEATTQVLRDEEAAAGRAARLSTGVALLVALLTSVLAVVSLRSILLPLRELTRRAGELARGDFSGSPVDLGGRDELVGMARTLEYAAATLSQVNAQARALAAGRLDDPCLDEPSPGVLGDLMHQNVTAMRSQAARLRHEAVHDQLTGLLNRAGLEEALDAPVPGEADAWLVYLDLDGFKQVNDRYGHGQGDEVLRVVAGRLRAAVGADDLVARLGGDEFVVVVRFPSGGTESGELEALTARLRASVCLPIARIAAMGSEPDGAGADPHVVVGVSLGRARLERGVPASAALAEADAAMYRAKRAGREAMVAGPVG